MKITIEREELGFVYRVTKEPHTSCVGIALSIGDALFEVAKTVARMPNDPSSATGGKRQPDSKGGVQ